MKLQRRDDLRIQPALARRRTGAGLFAQAAFHAGAIGAEAAAGERRARLHHLELPAQRARGLVLRSAIT